METVPTAEWTMWIMLITSITVFVSFIALIVKILTARPAKQPTMKGVIISLIIGLLPLYQILCFIGAMGDDRPSSTR